MQNASILAIALPLLGGFVLLLAGGESLVRGAGRLAQRLGMPPMLIALTVVAFGSSAPELVASLTSAVKNEPGIILGNVLGSNMANIALVIGLGALVHPIKIHRRLMRSELPLLVFLQIGLFYVMLGDNRISRVDGILLSALGLTYVLLIIHLARKARELVRARMAGLMPATADASGLLAATPEEVLGVPLDTPDTQGSMKGALLLTAVGLILLPVGAHFAVEGATSLAEKLGLSPRVIGLTVVSVGTSLPEIVTTLLAVARRDFGLAAGTVMGSNVFNICYVLGLTATAFPFDLPGNEIEKITFDLGATLTLTLVLYLFCSLGRVISRFDGFLLLLGYVGTLAWSIGVW